MKRAPKPIETIDDISDVTRFCDGGNYIFRGENKNYGQVSSGLYREYSEIENPLTHHHGFSVLDVEENIVKDARKHLQDGASDMEVLTALQHYGGKTNLIDFTKNLHIALYFACKDEINECGRLILMDQGTLSNTAINYTEFKEIIQTSNIRALPNGKSPRAIFQSSVFVHPHKGYLENDDYQSVIVNFELKSALLEHLQKHHDISEETVYNDLHGFIQNQSGYTTADVEFYRGLSCSNSGDFEGAVQHYGKAIKLSPQMLSAYANRGLALVQLKRFEEAIADHTQVVELQPYTSLSYYTRGLTYKLAGKLDAAVVDYNKAIEIGPRLAKHHVGLGQVYSKLQKYNDAISEFNKALQIEPDNHDAHMCLGTAYVCLPNYKEDALKHLRIARNLCIKKKLPKPVKILAPMIASLEKTVAKKTRPNTKPTKPKPKK